ncbi:MAG: rhodanese-like domain-containing protein [Pseudomonadota bacterium]|nr:rhodanese-like domain-containing protein [Pseudomonadota bacterium]
MRLPLVLLLFAVLGLVSAVPQPAGYLMGPVHGTLPASIAGGAVIDTPALAALLRRGSVVLLDVLPVPIRPPGLVPGAPWLPAPHEDIPGSIWIPGAGGGALAPAEDAFLRQRLAALTGNDRDHVLVVYCRQDCYLSWNAAKRAISYGYRHVYWYNGGIDAWRAAGLPRSATSPVEPRGPATRVE